MPLPPALAARLAKRGILKVSHVFVLSRCKFSASCVVHPVPGFLVNLNSNQNQIFIIKKLPGMDYVSSPRAL
jgi:hypothetical protein